MTVASEVRLGMLLWSQGGDWPTFEAGAVRADELGYDHLWTWDHLYAIFGNPLQPIFEGWAALAAWAKVTSRIRLGLLVGANTFRNPGLVAKLATSLDHISGGRAILGLGGAWFELEHTAYGIEFGTSPGKRLAWLDEAAGIVKALLAGEAVTRDGPRYHFDRCRMVPGPLQETLPLMIGGSGERKTLRTVAKYADMWNGGGDLPTVARKIEILRQHCEDVGRDPAEIELTVGYKPTIRDTEPEAHEVVEWLMEHNQTPMARIENDKSFWVGTVDQIAETMHSFRQIGVNTFIAELPAPYDDETMTRLMHDVKPKVATG
jgi:alkanesulfonate monooxygenase SsuD/methylene tetrahydromethanopterin reductase-like flavin-dependent oxidoreductase (luciferase family)